jgi:hypothetical protein
MSQSKTELIANYLKSAGYSPSVDEEGDIMFEYDGYPLFIHPDEEDSQVLKLFGFAWRSDHEEEDDSELILALQVANDCMAKFSGVKVITLPSRHIVVAVEQFYEPFETFQGTFDRILKSLKSCAEEVHEMMESDYDDEDDEDEDYEFDPESN